MINFKDIPEFVDKEGEKAERAATYTRRTLWIATIVFVALKIGGTISWPWIWVVSPVAFPLASIAIIFIVGLISTIWEWIIG